MTQLTIVVTITGGILTFMSDVTWLADKKNKLRRVASAVEHRLTGRRRVVVSLTTYPPRIDTVWQSLRSIFSQSYLPDKIVLYLAKSDFPDREADLPRSLLDMLWYDFEIRWVDVDLKPHKKWYWAFSDFKDDLVVTIDDDLIYRRTMLEELVAAHEAHPGAVIASRTHLIMFDADGAMCPYNEWILEAGHAHPRLVDVESQRLFATTGAGTLFDPPLFPEWAFNRDLIERFCLSADDVWLKLAEVAAGIPVVAATSEQLLTYVPGTQEVALCHQNLGDGGNDVCLGALIEYLTQEGIFTKPFSELVADASLDSLM